METRVRIKEYFELCRFDGRHLRIFYEKDEAIDCMNKLHEKLDVDTYVIKRSTEWMLKR